MYTLSPFLFYSSHDISQETPLLFDSEPASEMTEEDGSPSDVDCQLLVDRYAPKLYTELLSDDVSGWFKVYKVVVVLHCFPSMQEIARSQRLTARS